MKFQFPLVVNVAAHGGVGNNLLGAICHALGDCASQEIEKLNVMPGCGMFQFRGGWFDFILQDGAVRIFPSE